MSKNKFEDQSSETLKATEKNLKKTLFILLGLMLIFLGYTGYLVGSEKQIDTIFLTVVPVLFMVFSIFISGRKSLISSELRKRENTK